MSNPAPQQPLARWAGRLRRVPGFLRAQWVLRGARLGARVHVEGKLLVRGRRGLTLGDRAFFLGGPFATELVCAEGGALEIGAGTGLNYGASIEATRSVRIGAGCLLGALVRIRDDDGQRCAPVVIGDGVWIAHGAIIEPGVTIGDGAVVAAGAVVTGPVPARTMAVGNPARCLPLGLTGHGVAAAGQR